jgi:transcriptional regulator
MYMPEQFREERAEVLCAFIARHPLGALVATGPEGLIANHIPMLWHPQPDGTGVLSGHVARANPLWKLLAPHSPVLVIFTGAVHYITPSWYPAKQVDGKVVPTWNYSVVHAHGAIRFLRGAPEALATVRELTEHQEAARPAPWAVSDAPAEYLEAHLKHIVPFEIAVTRLTGKFKASQHRAADERASVAAALRAEGLSAEAIGELVREPEVR